MDSQTLPMSPEIREFLERLLEEAKITPTDADLKESMLSDLYSRLQVTIMQVLVEHLDEKDLEAYAKIAEEDQGKAAQFLQSKNSNMPQHMVKAMAEFRQTFLS